MLIHEFGEKSEPYLSSISKTKIYTKEFIQNSLNNQQQISQPMSQELQYFSTEINEIHAKINKLTLMAKGHENALTKQHKNMEATIMGCIHSLANNSSLTKQISSWYKNIRKSNNWRTQDKSIRPSSNSSSSFRSFKSRRNFQRSSNMWPVLSFSLEQPSRKAKEPRSWLAFYHC